MTNYKGLLTLLVPVLLAVTVFVMRPDILRTYWVIVAAALVIGIIAGVLLTRKVPGDRK